MDEVTKRSMLNTLSQRFEYFAAAECKNSSPLYEHLSLSIASDHDILGLAAQIPQGQPVPNLLFGAVHYLLLRNQDEELSTFYPSLTTTPQPPQRAFPHFHHFCLTHQDEIIHLIHSQRVQTNEVKRCAYLFPAFGIVFNLAQRQPLSLVEIGTSAGLNLMWDHYCYSYGEGPIYGDKSSPVMISSSFRSDKRPVFPTLLPVIHERIGIDLSIIDVRKPEDTLWIRALIWPEHLERAELLTSAIEVVRSKSPKLIEGDGIELLPGMLARLPAETAACVFHTHTFNQVRPEIRQQFAESLAENSKERDIYRISCEWIGTREPELELTVYRKGHKTETLLAYCDGHAKWIEWVNDF